MPPDPPAAPAARAPAYRALAVTVVTLALAYGVWYAYSVFLVALLEEFGDQLDPRGRDYATRVCSAAERMSQLIDDLLELSRAGRVSLHLQRVELSTMAQEVANELRRRQPERAVELVIEPGLTATGDEVLLRAVLENLLENAWKFTGRRKRPAIEVGPVQNTTLPTYYVRDNGAGFDPAYGSRLFVAFQRLHADREFPGTGIGLAIVQRIVSEHAGSIRVEENRPRGSVFVVELPAGGGAERDAAGRGE